MAQGIQEFGKQLISGSPNMTWRSCFSRWRPTGMFCCTLRAQIASQNPKAACFITTKRILQVQYYCVKKLFLISVPNGLSVILRLCSLDLQAAHPPYIQS
eukprot:g35290.t1